MSDPNSDSSRIERDLDQTRSRLGSHLSELQGRLSPGQALDDAMRYFRGSEGADFGRNLLANVRANPMPAALTGIGLAWLMATKPRVADQTAVAAGWERFGPSAPRPYGDEDHGATMARVRDAERGVSRHPDEAEHAYSARLDEVRGQAIGLARHARETTESFGERIRDALAAAERAVAGAASDLRDQIENAAGAAGGAVGSFAASAQNIAQSTLRSAGGALSQGGKATTQAGGNLVATIAESPVLLGALGLAAGALLGVLLPRSDQEEAALGGIAGQARDTVTSLAKDGLERGRQVARTVVDKGRDSAQAHGLAGGKSAGELVDAALSGNLVGDAKAVAQEVLQAGDEAVRKAVAPAGDRAAGQSAQPSSSAS